MFLFERSFNPSAAIWLRAPMLHSKPELPKRWKYDLDFQLAADDIVHHQLSKMHSDNNDIFDNNDEILLKQYLEYRYMMSSYDYWETKKNISWWLDSHNNYRGDGYSARRNCILGIFNLLGFKQAGKEIVTLDGINYETFNQGNEALVFIMNYYLNSAKDVDISSNKLNCSVITLDVQYKVGDQPKRHGFENIFSDFEKGKHGDYWLTYYDIIDLIETIPDSKMTDFSV